MTLARTKLGKRSTAAAVIQGISLAGKRAVVTGAASGIGVETARALAGAGAAVIVAVRNTAEGDKLVAALPGSGHACRALDLSDLPTVRAFAAATPEPVDLLVCNAGVMASPLMFTKQGLELQMGTNHLGHFLLVELLRKQLTQSARVVLLSSSAHKGGKIPSMLATLDDDKKYEKRKYTPFGAYGDSKLANMLHARALAKRLPAGQSAFSVHPGVIATNLIRHLGFLGTLWKIAGPLVLKSAEQGAATTVFACTAPGLEAHSGIFLADCNEATSSPAGRDDAAAEKLWDVTEKLLAAAPSG